MLERLYLFRRFDLIVLKAQSHGLAHIQHTTFARAGLNYRLKKKERKLWPPIHTHRSKLLAIFRF